MPDDQVRAEEQYGCELAIICGERADEQLLVADGCMPHVGSEITNWEVADELPLNANRFAKNKGIDVRGRGEERGRGDRGWAEGRGERGRGLGLGRRERREDKKGTLQT